MLRDRYGLEISTTSSVAQEQYIEACDHLLGAEAGVAPCLAAAIAADPTFALPHAAMARVLQMNARPDDARRAAELATQLAGAGATDRERQHIETVRLAVNGQTPAALELIRRHVGQFPNDAVALAPATGVFGMIGFSGRIGREHELLELLEPLAPHYGDDWWFRTVLAFALTESGQWSRSRELAEHALEQRPQSPHAAHTLTHALYEAGDDAATTAFLESWLPDSDNASMLHCHIWWHYALQLVAAGRHADAWDAFSSNCLPGTTASPAINVFTDSASFLWRSELAGAERDADRWTIVKDFYEATFPRPMVFVDAHVGLAYAALDDTEQIDVVEAQLTQMAVHGNLPAGHAAATLTRGYRAFARGDWSGAIEVFEPVMPEVVRIGGSRAQRDLVTNTLLAAYVHADRHDAAAAFLHASSDRRPNHPVVGLAPESTGDE